MGMAGLCGFETTSRALRVVVEVLDDALDGVAQEIVELLTELGCEVTNGAGPHSTTRPTARTTLHLIVLPETDATALAEHALRDRAGEVLHFIGPKLSVEEMVHLHTVGTGLYLKTSDSAEESAARLLAFARRCVPGFRGAVVSSELKLAGLSLSSADLKLIGPLGEQMVTETEARLLSHLLTHEATHPESLAKQVFQRRDAAGRGRDLVYRHIANLRRKLNAVGAEGWLTRDSTGYRLRPLAATQSLRRR